jgi:hypothetical protein
LWAPAAALAVAAALAACGSPYEMLTIHRTGGIAGFDETFSVRKDGIGRIENHRDAMTRTVKLDKDALERIARVLSRLPEESPSFDLGRGMDLMSYEMTLEPAKKGEPRTYRWDDGVRPAEAKQESTIAALRDLSNALIGEVKKAAER